MTHSRTHLASVLRFAIFFLKLSARIPIDEHFKSNMFVLIELIT